MFRIIGVVVVLALTGGVSLAQAPADPAAGQVAAIDPNAPLPTDTNAVSQCTTMAQDVNLADPTAGPCITASQSYIATLVAAPAPLAAPAEGAASPRDAALSTFVGEIAALTQDNICDKRDEELAAAVDAAAAAAEADATRTQFAEIARTIREVCTDGTTAAIADSSPADAGVL